MGKKSRKSGGAKAKAASNASSAVNGGKDTVGDSGCGGGILASGKKQKCFRCLASLKEPSKAHACPGCSLLYCWRCERKFFAECPNGMHCIDPTRRCKECTSSRTVKKAISPKDTVPYNDMGKVIVSKESLGIFRERICHDNHALPFVSCGGHGCKEMECYFCFHDVPVSRLLRCISCAKGRCGPCRDVASAVDHPSMSALIEIAESTLFGIALFEEDISAAMEVMRKDTDSYATCTSCSASYCYQCLDEERARFVARGLLSALTCSSSLDASSLCKPKKKFLCSPCYWSAKPCSNPKCPNKTGVPTKRCGGCHLDRYCSVECQAAAYPDHVGKCQKIQAQRAAGMREK